MSDNEDPNEVAAFVEENEEDEEDDKERLAAIEASDPERRAEAEFVDYQRRAGEALTNADLDLIETIDEPIPQEIRVYIQHLKYPKALMGEFSTGTRDHPMLENKGQLVNDKELKLFQHINTILQDPKCIFWLGKHFKPATQKTYAVHVSRYILYVARKTALDETNFRVDGLLMKDCFADLLETGDSLPEENERKVKYTSIKAFKYSLSVLQYCLGIIRTRNMGKKERSTQLESIWRKIPLVDEIDDFFVEKQHEHYLQLKSQYPDKARPSMFQPKYTFKDHRQMMINMLKKTARGKIKDIYDGIGALVAFSLSHHYLFRGQNMLLLELSDTVYSVEETRYGSVPVLGFQFLKGKTMDAGSLPGLTGACRNKDVVICPLMAIAMSYWYQLDFEDNYGPLAGGKAPDFLDKRSWYDPKVLFCDSSESRLNQSISNSKLINLFAVCLESIQFESLKKSHIGRVTNSYRADAFGVSTEEIRRQGRWQLDVLLTRYISHYAHEFIHFSAGFRNDEPYFIPRNIPVPEELQILIFPWLEEAIESVLNRVYPQKTEAIAKDGMAIKFLRMLKEFRSIIIQDLALLLDVVPDCVFAKHPIARDPRFLAFKEEVKQAHEKHNQLNAIPHFQEAIDAFAPQIALKLKLLQVQQDILQQRQTAMFSAQLKKFEELRDQLPQAMAAAFTDQLSDQFTSLSQKQTQSVKSLMNHTWAAVSKAFSGFVDGTFGDQMMSKLMEKFDTAMPHYIHQVMRSTLSNESSAAAEEPNKRRKVTREPPPDLRESKFRLLDVVSVSSVWEEWFISTPERESIEERNRLYGTNWRCDQLSQYKRRRVIITFLERLEKELNVGSSKAVELLEKFFKDHTKSNMKSLNSSLTHGVTADDAMSKIKELFVRTEIPR